MTIYIFGDSYADPSYETKYLKWFEQLEKTSNEQVVNTALGGTGPYYAFDKFFELYNMDKISIDDKVVFILSSSYRIPFPFIKRTEDISMAHCVYYDDQSKRLEQKYNYLKEFKYEIRLFFDTLVDDINFLNYKNVCFLKMLSLLNKFKIVVFTVFDINDNLHSKKYNKEKYDLKILNDDNFYYHDTPLMLISLSEFIDVDDENLWYVDMIRSNHFSKRNHDALFSLIYNKLFDNNYPIEPFKSSFIEKLKVDNDDNILIEQNRTSHDFDSLLIEEMSNRLSKTYGKFIYD